jgi:hypothetical protein
MEFMLKTPMPYQHELEMVTRESLVPADHLVRKIAAAVDLKFIRERVAHLYCPDNGRPALDPVLNVSSLNEQNAHADRDTAWW